MPFKLITPMGMLVTVALLAIYASYAFWTAYFDKSWIYGALGVLAVLACYGAAMLRPWSQYLVYLLTALFIAGWLYSVYLGAKVDYFGFFFPSSLAAIKALAPGFALVLLSGVAARITFSHFCRAGDGSQG